MMPEAILVLSSSVFLYTLRGGGEVGGLGRPRRPGASTVSSAGLPSSRKMKSYWRESSGGLRGW